MSVMNENWEYWKSTRNYTLWLHLFEANLIPTSAAGKTDNFEYYVVVYHKIDRQGTKQKSFPQKSLRPVWNQNLEFRDMNYHDVLQLEIKRIGGKGLYHNEVIATQDLPVKWLLENLASTEGNVKKIELEHKKRNTSSKAQLQYMNTLINNTSSQDGEGGDVIEEEDILPRVTLPQMGAPITPIEFKSEKYNGNLTIGLSSFPAIPMVSKDGDDITSNYQVANLGNFSCVVLP